ncbi:MAG: hypothetical protein A2132_00280 [Nitrospirae bacterium RBG_16_43_11]|nr:MAG: hypothetical protein A2132_00280 [Nitrospirae bacterium RBG_16_43_11]
MLKYFLKPGVLANKIRKFTGKLLFGKKNKGYDHTDNIARKFWEVNPNAAYQNQWIENPIIASQVYYRMSGGHSHKYWLSWLLEDYFAGKRFKRMLSPGCGVGDHEIIVAKSGVVDEIDAFDFSDSSIGIAKDKAEKLGLQINFYNDNLDTFVIPDGRRYDLVLCTGSVHHVKELERFFAMIHNVLDSDGYFVINEYVGECYNIYSKKQVDIINRMLSCFPQEMRSSDKDKFQNDTLSNRIAIDPSESVRSKFILPLLKNYFDIEVKHPFGGCILHPLYPYLKADKFMNGEVETSVLLKLLLEFEAILMDYQFLESDFVLCISRPKRYEV